MYLLWNLPSLSMLFPSLVAVSVLSAGATIGAQDRPAPADLILHGGRVWTADAARPEAQAVAVRGDRILRVGTDAEALALRGPSTQTIDLRGRLLLPGFNDAHTHFENACDWKFQVGLYDTSDPREIVRHVAVAARRVPKGLWIRGGDYGAAAAWDAAAKGRPSPAPPVLLLRDLDDVTPDHPVVLKRADGACFANSKALALARWRKEMPDPRGGRMERDAGTGALTGLLFGRSSERMAELIPPPSLERKLAGARLVLEELASDGITSIGDVARLEAASRRALFHTHVERSSSDLEIFRELQRRGELSVRVYAFLTLRLLRETLEAGIRPRSDEGLIRYGGLKSFVDGYLMEQPHASNPGYAGDFTFRFIDEKTMAADVAAADGAGFDPAVHTIGDKAHRLLLDWYEAAIRGNPPRDRRFRVIHAEHPSPADVARMGQLGLLADVTPAHLLRDVKAVERRVGPERARTTYPWQSLIRAGVRVNLVSDMPGSFNEQEEKPKGPIEIIGQAVTRRPETGAPWHPEERLTIEQAILAYTANPAFASYEEDRKGRIREGQLADLVVLSHDILKLAPEQIRQAKVHYTILGGRVLYRHHAAENGSAPPTKGRER